MSNEKRAGTDVILKTIASQEFQGKLRTSLPANIDPDRFTRVAITALQQNPDILQGDRNSLYLAILACAQAGLECDGKQAALVRFGNKIQFLPMAQGIILRLADCGITCDTQVVYEGDLFDVEYGDNPKITHKPPKLGTKRGEMLGAYAILKAKDGTVYREVMDAEQIEAVRAQSRAKNSLLWTQFAGEAWRKTVLRRCAKRIAMPLDQRAERAIEADNAAFDFSQETFAPVPETTVVAEQSPAAPAEAAPHVDQKAAQDAMESIAPVRPRALAAVVEHRAGEGDIF